MRLAARRASCRCGHRPPAGLTVGGWERRVTQRNIPRLPQPDHGSVVLAAAYRGLAWDARSAGEMSDDWT